MSLAFADLEIHVSQGADRRLALAVDHRQAPRSRSALAEPTVATLIRTTLPSAISTTRSHAPAQPAEWVIDHDRGPVGVAQPAERRRGRSPRSPRPARPSARRRARSAAGAPRLRRSRPAAAHHRRGGPGCWRARPQAEGRQRLVRRLRRDPSAPARRTAATTFSRADSVGQRLPDWKTTAISLPRIPPARLLEAGERAPVDPHLASRWHVHCRCDREHRALAAPGGPHDRDHLARLDRRLSPRSATVSVARRGRS